MSTRAKPPTPAIVQLKITLRDVDPPVWRRIQVPAGITLMRLADALLFTMGWLGYHLSEYRIEGQAYGDPDPDFDYGREIRDLRRVRLQRVMPKLGEQFEFLYDFGDGWVHDVTIESIMEPERRVTYPRVIAGERACPPEDVGGPYGYVDFLAAIADPSHEEHDNLLDWAGGEFDPEWFDLDGANEAFELDPIPLR